MRESLLFPGHSIAHHPRPRLRQLRSDILHSDISGAHDAKAEREVGAVSLDEVAGGLEHRESSRA